MKTKSLYDEHVPSRPIARVETAFASYVALAHALIPDLSGVVLLDESLQAKGESGDLDGESSGKWVRSLHWLESPVREPEVLARGPNHWWAAIPIQQANGRLLGVMCTSRRLDAAHSQPSRYADTLALRLKPLLDCMRRELAAAVRAHGTEADLAERTADLEWLFKLTSGFKGTVDDQRSVEELLGESTARLRSALGVLCIPEKRLTLQCERDKTASATLLDVWGQSRQYLMSRVQRQNQPLVVNGTSGTGSRVLRCKMLCVPVVREAGRVIGALAFYNPPEAPDFRPNDVFLSQHLGFQAAGLVDAQFDLMTGLYTRSGLDQLYRGFDDPSDCVERSILYLDVDHMHVANELHGFEVGNELIVRVADTLSAPLLPDGALAARISGDRFAVILPNTTSDQAMEIAQNLQAAVSQLVIGPTREVIDISISCGVSALLPMQDGLARAIAAAELACKTAKRRGRNRVELYAFDDGSMMRRHQDALSIGQLRSALKADRLLLYAQRIAPLQNPSLPGGYEILLRLRERDGSLVAPGPLIEAAQRYQLLPTIDRWVASRAFQMLGPYRSMLKSRGLSMSINVSGQSIGDEAFIQQFIQLLKDANLPRGCVSVELTEQAAIKNLARASQMVERLRAAGCEIALDDFGTGANSLTVLKGLNVSRVKIDGSFVRDILTDQNSLATVRATVELAKGLHIQTVAEYVENDAIAREMRKLGVDYGQGYGLGRPQPLAGLLENLDRNESRRLHRLFLET